MIHTVKGFGIVNKAKIDVFLELSCFIFSAIVLPNRSQIDDHDGTMIIEENTRPQSDLFDNHFEGSSHVYLQVIYQRPRWPI